MVVRRTKAEWLEIVEKYKKSGKTMAAWCRENGVNVKTLGHHVNSVGKSGGNGRTLDEWRILSEKQKSSGMGLSAWCKANGINENTMWSAESRLAKIQQSSANVPGQEINPSAKSKWVEIKIPEAKPATELPMVSDTQAYQNKSSPVVMHSSDDEHNVVHTVNATTSKSEYTKPKETFACMRIRVKNLEIEVNNEYPVEKLMTLVRELVNLC